MTDMAKIDLPYVQTFRDRYGKARHYFRRRGCPRVALPGAPGSREFLSAYAAALERAPKTAPVKRPVQPRSINALVVEYYRSADFIALRDSTKRGYRNHLDRFRAKYGDGGAASIRPTDIATILHKMAATPGAARNLRKRLRTLFDLAVRLGWRQDNPVAVTRPPKVKSKGFTPWSEDDIAAFRARWPAGSKPRLALELLIHTGQRRSDVVRMGQQHVRDGRISVAQVKTDARLRIRLHPELQAEIAKCPAGNLTFLMTDYGRPFTAAGFTRWFVERAQWAGLQGRSPHGLRKAAGRRLAEAGCSAKQIAAVLGHASLTEVERYTRDADQERLADAAIEALEARSGTAGVNLPSGQCQTR